MANNCGDGVYNISYTDTTKNPIVVNKKTLNQDVVDITLLGKSRLEYGEVFDENLLHLLENFASPESTTKPGTPDFNQTYSNLLEQPTKGQIWYNTTKLRIYVYDGTEWVAYSESSDIGGNSGIIADGVQIPRPISQITGYVFDYSECSWIVSPFAFPAEVDYMTCYTDTQGHVTAEYRLSDFQNIISGYAFYQIIGIKANINEGNTNPVIPPAPTPTPNASIPPTPSISVTPTSTPLVPLSPTPTMSPSRTPVPSISATPSPTAAPSPTPVPSVTPSPTRIPALFLAGPGSNISANCSGLPTQSCAPTASSTLSASGGVPPYTYHYNFVSGSPQMNTFGNFNSAQSGSIAINWIGPNQQIGVGGHTYVNTFQYYVTDSIGQTTYLGNTTTVTYNYIDTT